MTTVESYLRLLRRMAIAVAALNFVSVISLDLREWLVYFDPWFIWCVVLPAFVIGLPSLPYLLPLNTSSRASPPSVMCLVITGLAFIGFELLWFGQIAVATFFRDPLWNFYWPWAERLPKVTALNSVNLSEWFWVYVLDQHPPANPMVRESPGIIGVAFHLLALPLLAAELLRRYSRQVSFGRILIFAVIVQVLSGVVLKIGLQWLMNLKYLVAFPEQMLNI